MLLSVTDASLMYMKPVSSDLSLFHLVILSLKISERSFTLRFDDSMSSFSSEKKRN